MYERKNGPSGPREMHNAKCTECGKDTKVPFKPKPGRPVYCRECFQKNRDKPRSQRDNLPPRHNVPDPEPTPKYEDSEDFGAELEDDE